MKQEGQNRQRPELGSKDWLNELRARRMVWRELNLEYSVDQDLVYVLDPTNPRDGQLGQLVSYRPDEGGENISILFTDGTLEQFADEQVEEKVVWPKHLVLIHKPVLRSDEVEFLKRTHPGADKFFENQQGSSYRN